MLRLLASVFAAVFASVATVFGLTNRLLGNYPVLVKRGAAAAMRGLPEKKSLVVTLGQFLVETRVLVRTNFSTSP